MPDTPGVIDVEQIKTRSIAGVLAITSRTFLLQIVALMATFILTVFLSPQEYGVFFVVSAVINFLVYFSDIGLAAALIQKRQSPTPADLSTVFTIQQLLVTTLVGIALIGSQWVAGFYHLTAAGLWLLRALILSLWLSSWRTIPSIQLERSLNFSKLVIPQVVETLLFYLVAVVLAWQGWGVTAFTWAVLVRSFSGLIVLYWLYPWRPQFGFHLPAARQLISFGLPFQAHSLLALIKDDLLTAFLGKILPLTQLGFIGWAQKWSLFPLRMFMDSINRVTFPAYSRLQDQLEILRRAVEKSLFFISLLIFPAVIGLVAISPAFVALFPRYLKWQPALISLAFFAVSSLWASISTTLTNTLSATGRINTNLKLMLLWTSLTWILTPWLIHRLGFNGAALASALVSFTSILPVIIVKRFLPIRVAAHTLPALFTASFTGLLAYWLSRQVRNLSQLFGVILLCVVVYSALNWLIQKDKIKLHSQTLLKVFKRS